MQVSSEPKERFNFFCVWYATYMHTPICVCPETACLACLLLAAFTFYYSVCDCFMHTQQVRRSTAFPPVLQDRENTGILSALGFSSEDKHCDGTEEMIACILLLLL